MAYSTKLKEAIAYLREEIPTRDVSKDPLVAHPHNTTRTIPERLPAARIKELSQLSPGIAVLWTFVQWASIGAAIALCLMLWNPILYVLAVMFIGAFITTLSRRPP